MLVVNDADAAVFPGILLHNLQRVVLGTIVDNDELPVGKSLGNDTINRLSQETCTIIAG